MKKFSTITKVIATSLVISMAITGCGKPAASAASASASASVSAPAASASGAAASTATGKKKTFAVITQALNSEYWNDFKQGAIDGGAEVGVDIHVNGPLTEEMVTQQIAMVEAEISNGVDGILVAANQPSSIAPTLDKAKAKGIPVIEVDVESNWKDRAGYVGAGNYEGGKEAGKWFGDHLNAGDKVAVIRGLPGDPTHDLRENGCLDGLKASGKNFVLIPTQPANSERGLAVNIMENILQANPDVKGVFCTNDEMALGAYKAVESSKKDVKVIGFDGSTDALNSVKAGKMSATISCSGYDMSKLAVKTMNDILNGKALTGDKRVLITPLCIDSTTVDAAITKQAEITKKLGK